ncbi:hypothetical protein EDC04DRAFT_2704937 [Pisolithus marmoratus]|nr:hypothetical protein EDC04DRAFT_2704937 [Pisolithus marmoratus]
MVALLVVLLYHLSSPLAMVPYMVSPVGTASVPCCSRLSCCDLWCPHMHGNWSSVLAALWICIGSLSCSIGHLIVHWVVDQVHRELSCCLLLIGRL